MIMYMYKKICITNRHLVSGDFLEQIEKVTEEDVDLLILREKDLKEEEYKLLAKNVIKICEKNNVICMIHTYYNVARELNHPYIHLTMKDIKLLSEEDKQFFKVIGVSTHSVEEAVLAEKLGAMYITASHIFETKCKEGLEPRGIEYLKDVINSVNIKVYALGGIKNENSHLCINVGANGVCMMSEYMQM